MTLRTGAESVQITPWRDGLHVRVRRGEEWTEWPSGPGLPLVSLVHAKTPRDAGRPSASLEALRSLIRGIPAPVARAVHPVRIRQIQLARVLGLAPDLIDLVADNAALVALALLFLAGTRCEKDAEVIALLHQPRPALLRRLLGAGEGESAPMWLLKKLDCRGGITAQCARALHAVLQQPVLLPGLRRLPRIDVQALSMLLRPHSVSRAGAYVGLVEPAARQVHSGDGALVHESRRWLAAFEIEATLQDCRDAAADLGLARAEVDAVLQRARTLRGLRRLRVRWAQRAGDEHFDAARDCDGSTRGQLPEPLLPGDEESRIVPLTTVAALRREGVEMRHCLCQVHARFARSRDASYYAVGEGADRATLEIGVAGGNPVVRQLRGRENADPSRHAIELVERWLRQGASRPAAPFHVSAPRRESAAPEPEGSRRTWATPREDELPQCTGPPVREVRVLGFGEVGRRAADIVRRPDDADLHGWPQPTLPGSWHRFLGMAPHRRLRPRERPCPEPAVTAWYADATEIREKGAARKEVLLCVVADPLGEPRGFRDLADVLDASGRHTIGIVPAPNPLHGRRLRLARAQLKALRGGVHTPHILLPSELLAEDAVSEGGPLALAKRQARCAAEAIQTLSVMSSGFGMGAQALTLLLDFPGTILFSSGRAEGRGAARRATTLALSRLTRQLQFGHPPPDLGILFACMAGARSADVTPFESLVQGWCGASARDRVCTFTDASERGRIDVRIVVGLPTQANAPCQACGGPVVRRPTPEQPAAGGLRCLRCGLEDERRHTLSRASS